MATYFQIADHFNARLAQLTSSPQDSEEYRSCVSNLISMRKQSYDEMNALVASEIAETGVAAQAPRMIQLHSTRLIDWTRAAEQLARACISLEVCPQVGSRKLLIF